MNLSRRELRGAGIVLEGGHVHRISNGVFAVDSSHGSGQYSVEWLRRENRWLCSCPDFMKHVDARHFACKHVGALRWSLATPLTVLGNAPVTVGPYDGDREPYLLHFGRAVPVQDAVSLYKSALELLSKLPSPITRRLPRPVLSRGFSAAHLGV